MPEVIFPHLGIEIQTLSRTAFKIFGIQVYWYGLLVGLGVLLGAVTAFREAKRIKLNMDKFYNFGFCVIIASIIGARVYYVIFEWDSYKYDLLKIFAFREGGLAIYGAVIAAILTCLIYTKVTKENFMRYADCGTIGLILGQAIGRWGNFINKEVFGEYTSSLFAMQLIKDQVNPYDISERISQNIIIQNGIEYIQVHPTFFYEFVLNISIFIFLMIFRKHKKYDGQLFLLYFLLYGFGRFFIEGIRTDQLFLFGTAIPVSQALSAVLALVGASALVYYELKARKNNPAIG